jgi:iron complex transport system substrate-binding protein
MQGKANIFLFVLAALPALSGCAATPAASPAANERKPMRVMSTNQCTDQLVLALLPPERIASVTSLSRDPDGSLMYQEARRVGVNHGLAEEIVRQKPDLIVTSAFSAVAANSLLKRLDYPMIEVDDASSFADIRRITRQVAKAVGEEARGEALIAHMDKQLDELAGNGAPRLRVAAWDGAGFNASKGSLYDTVLKAAGAINVTSQSGEKPEIENLLLAAPTLLVKGAGIGRKPGMHDNVDRHPLVRRFWDGPRTVTIRQAYYVCGTPFVADATLKLRNELRAAAAKIGKPLPFAPGEAL